MILTEHERFSTDFISKISMITGLILISMAFIIQNLLSFASTNDIKSIPLSFNQCCLLFLLFCVVLASVFLLVPLIFQSVIHIFEDAPDKKLPLKRSVNKTILGLSLITFVLLLMIVPAICNSNIVTDRTFIFFLVAFLVDMALVHLKLFVKKDLSFTIFAVISIIGSCVFFGFCPSAWTLIGIVITKIVVLETTYFVKRFQFTEEGRKKNIYFLNFIILVAVYTIFLYAVYRTEIIDYIQSRENCLVDYLYSFFYKCVTENPLGITKMFPGGGK